MLDRYYYAGAPRVPGTQTPGNVTGDCPHRHDTPDEARECIEDANADLRSYVDRVVMVYDPCPPADMWERYGSHYPYDQEDRT